MKRITNLPPTTQALVKAGLLRAANGCTVRIARRGLQLVQLTRYRILSDDGKELGEAEGPTKREALESWAKLARLRTPPPLNAVRFERVA